MNYDTKATVTGFPSSGHFVLDDFWTRNGRRFHYLWMVGGSNPSGYGFIHGGKGVFGHVGLEQGEFFAHLEISGFVQGMLAALPQNTGIPDWMKARMDELTAEVQAARAKDLPATAGANSEQRNIEPSKQ